MLRPCQRPLVLALACAGAILAASPASAIVPPSDCGNMTVSGKRYNVKADQLRCSPVRTYARRYLSSRTKPKGFTCKNYGATTKLRFRCSKGVQVFFAIRR